MRRVLLARILRLSGGLFAKAFAAALVLAAVGWAVACLPDLRLPDAPPPPSNDAAGNVLDTGPTSQCGDGVVNPDSGEECDPGPTPAPGCVNCIVQCEDGGNIDLSTKHCYFEAPDATAAFSNADQLFCAVAGAHIVTFASEREMGFVSGTVAVADPFWVGLVLDPVNNAYGAAVPIEPGWSPFCTGCYAHLEAGADAMPTAPPIKSGSCVLGKIALGQTWSQGPCNDKRRIICEREPLGTRAYACGDATCFTLPATASTKRYTYVPDVANAGDAPVACSTRFGGALVMFDSPEEREQLSREITGLTSVALGDSTEFWIGLTNPGSGWQWDDGQTRAIPWGLLRGKAEPGKSQPGARAFVRIDTHRIDSELAHAGGPPDASTEQRPYVCQIPL